MCINTPIILIDVYVSKSQNELYLETRSFLSFFIESPDWGFHCRELSASLLSVTFHPVENTQMMYQLNTGQSSLCTPTILRTFLGTQDPLINKISKAQHYTLQQYIRRHQLQNQPKLYSL